jgi:hypothetical protein
MFLSGSSFAFLEYHAVLRNITYAVDWSSLKNPVNKKMHASQRSEQSFHFTAHYCLKQTGTGPTGRLRVTVYTQGQRTATVCVSPCLFPLQVIKLHNYELGQCFSTYSMWHSLIFHCKRNDSIKMDLEETGCESGVLWIRVVPHGFSDDTHERTTTKSLDRLITVCVCV